MTHEEDLVTRARAGDRAALNELVSTTQDLIYNLALRMLGSPADAQDASQEILIRVVTNLDSFRGESSFRTWVYRVASNQLLKTRRRSAESRFEGFEGMAEYLDAGLAEERPLPDDQLLIREAKLVCTSAMVLRLDRAHRLAFILGEILELPSDEAAAVLDIAPDAFRKRLSRARTRIAEFMKDQCGLVNPSLPCRCAKQAARALSEGHVDPKNLTLATHAVNREGKQPHLNELDALTRAIEVIRSHPDYTSPASVVEGLRHLLSSGQSGLLE